MCLDPVLECQQSCFRFLPSPPPPPPPSAQQPMTLTHTDHWIHRPAHWLPNTLTATVTNNEQTNPPSDHPGQGWGRLCLEPLEGAPSAPWWCWDPFLKTKEGQVNHFNITKSIQVLLYSIQRKTWVRHMNNKGIKSTFMYKRFSLRAGNNVQTP